MTPLPPSEDKEFWKGDVSTYDKQPPELPKHHKYEWRGPFAVCITCKNTHSVPIDPKKFDIVNGELVSRVPDVIK